MLERLRDILEAEVNQNQRQEADVISFGRRASELKKSKEEQRKKQLDQRAQLAFNQIDMAIAAAKDKLEGMGFTPTESTHKITSHLSDIVIGMDIQNEMDLDDDDYS